jgi:hypothetical protein
MDPRVATVGDELGFVRQVIGNRLMVHEVYPCMCMYVSIFSNKL